MRRSVNVKPDSRGYDGGSITHTAPDAPNLQASDAGISPILGSQNDHAFDPNVVGNSSDPNDTPETEKADPSDGRPFKCDAFWADGSKCLEDFKRKGDLTKHRNAYHNSSARAQAQTNTSAKPATEPKGLAGDSFKPEAAVKVRKTTVKTKNAAVSKNRTRAKRSTGSRAKRNTGNPLYPEVPVQIQTHMGSKLTAEAENLLEAKPIINNLHSEYHLATQANHEEASRPEAQSHLATDFSQGTTQMASSMSSYNIQPSFNQQWVDPYGQRVAYTPVPADTFNTLSGPNEALRSTTNHSYPSPRPQNTQQPQPFGAQDAIEAQNPFLSLGTFEVGGSGYMSHSYDAQNQTPIIPEQQDNFEGGGPTFGYPQYQIPMIPQHDPFGSGGPEATGYGYPQCQTPKQQDSIEDASPGGSTCENPQEWAQILPQQDAIVEDGSEIAIHGFLPEKDHFGKNCFGLEGEYCCACRARFLEWFPTSEFRPFVEVCLSGSVEYYPPM